MDLDTFFVSVERLRDNRLNGKPLIIGGKNGRGVVTSCSYEARQFGVHSAMPMRTAMQLCPDAIIISGDMESYSYHSKMVTDVIADTSPVYEKSSIDEFYLDLTGMDRFFGSYKWALELRRKIIKETGLPISCGHSSNKMVSKVATGEAKPNGAIRIPDGDEMAFLAPMHISKIPLLGPVTAKKLVAMGIERVSTLRQVPLYMMEQLFGKMGRVIWKRAHGIDHSEVVPYHEAKSISTERTFSQSTIDMPWLRSMLTSMAEKLAFKLRDSDRLTGCITVKIRYPILKLIRSNYIFLTVALTMC